MTALQDVPVSVKDDAITLLCMTRVGSGVSRDVYACTLNPEKWVVKVETDADGRFQNVAEHLVWEAAQYMNDLKRWFAPVVNISDMGRWLVMERTSPVTLEELKRKVKQVPACFTDLKPSNWGKIGTRYVCHDYGVNMVTENGLNARLRKAEWWE